MQTSDKIDQITPALLAAQADIPELVKDSTNPHFQSTYLSLAGLLKVVRPILLKHELALLQSTVDGDDSGVTVTTRLLHASGQWVEGGVRLPLEKSTAQSAGSAFSYGRRYGLEALFGVTAVEDDDGNAATAGNLMAPPRAKRPVSDRPQATGKDANDSQVCPDCGGEMWDNREKKASGQFKPTSPDFACKDKQCGKAIWLEKKGKSRGPSKGMREREERENVDYQPVRDIDPPDADGDLPF